MTSPRTPRQWAEGDTIPADVTAVHHYHEPLLDECGTRCAWIRRASDWKGPWGYALEEAEMLRRMGPVTEVIEGAPLSEVLPETPEPPRPECECFVVPEEQWTRHYDATEPGSMLEPNPDCQVHFPASQSVPAVPVSSTGGKETGEGSSDAQGDAAELRNLLVGLLVPAIASQAVPPRQFVDQYGARVVEVREAIVAAADALLANCWRPPLPGSETERPRRCPALTPESDLVTEGRQCQQYEGHAHDHTWYGDNGHAYSLWAVTS